MNAPQETMATHPALQNALSHLKQAEVDLLALVRTGSHPDHAQLFEVHAFIWEAISALSKAVTTTDKPRRLDKALRRRANPRD